MATTASFRSMKFLLIRALRSAGLLRLADTFRFLLGQVRVWPANRRFRAQHPQFATPPPHLAYDAVNHVDWQRYLDSGLQHARIFSRAIRAEGPPGVPLEVLEWGCGPGRLIRHMKALLPEWELHLAGTDYNPESIAWCRQYLAGIEFAGNELDPPLPFDTARFDVVYNLSVFTHLSKSVQETWVEELRRVLKPGGLLISTIAGEAHRYLLAAPGELAAFDAGQPVVQGNYQEGRKWFLALHPATYVRDKLFAAFADVRRLVTHPEDGIVQEVWIARKPPDPATSTAIAASN